MGSLGLPRVPLQWGVRGPFHGIPLGSQGFPSHGSANRFAAVNKYYGVSWGRHYELLEVIKRYYRHEGRYYGLLRNIPQAITGKNMGHSLELGPEPQMARNCSSSPPRGRRWLEIAARACPGAAEYSTGAARARSRRMIDGRLSSVPGTAECATGAARACPEAAKRPTGATRACPVAAACSKSVARAHSREVRSFLEMAARKVLPPVRLLSASTSARLHFASCT